MKALIKLGILVLIAGTSVKALAQVGAMDMKADSSKHIILSGANLTWMDAPAGLPKGAKVAVLSGDPSKEGTFTIRIMFPANYEIKPHWHPTSENITVLKGVFYLGTQETFDKTKASRLEEGSFASIPAKHVHYAFSKAPVTIQLHGMGPFAITYIKASDDPRTVNATDNSKSKM